MTNTELSTILEWASRLYECLVNMILTHDLVPWGLVGSWCTLLSGAIRYQKLRDPNIVDESLQSFISLSFSLDGDEFLVAFSITEYLGG